MPQAPSIPGPYFDPQSLFASPVNAYGQKLTQTERDQLAIAQAMRKVDPCGFIDPEVAKDIPGAQYQYSQGFAGCTLYADKGGDKTVPAVTISLRDRGNIGTTHKTSLGGMAVEESETTACMYRASLHLAAVPGAPKNPEVADMLDRYFPLTVSGQPPNEPPGERSNVVNCDQVKAVATGALRILDRGLPLRSADGPIPVPLLENDPCALYPELQGFSGYLVDGAAYFRCIFSGSGLKAKAGLTFSPVARALFDSAQHKEDVDGVTVYIGLDGPESCTAFAMAGNPLPPVKIGQSNRGDENTMVPTLEVRGGYCDVNKQVVAAGIKKFTGK
ncbi:hypothetical protein [Mycobacteroides saopaulense]|uniref:hypothetical protein n=1 Tax=Mycobacteroides saopaulense TaxID=1578165 RepID=UPI0010427E64|nr:hypothetical protein [Mycobacteroides saopaulense]